MTTNIFVPSKINVGFQNRKDTYTGKLAYVIYFDEKGKLRKEASWNSWRDKNIDNVIYENEPTEGFVLNKRVGGVEESWGWNPRKTYTRVYDPRGFEFEITVANLLWILENCDCLRGKGLQGQFVYGWDGKDLVLVPVESSDYKEIKKKNEIIHNNEFIKAKDLIIGATYETLGGEKFVYMGKHDIYEYEYNNYFNKRGFGNGIKEWTYPLDETWFEDNIFGGKDRKYRSVNQGANFWFIKLGNPNAFYSSDKENSVSNFKTISKKFAFVVSTVCDNISEHIDLLTDCHYFSPIDYTKNKILSLPFENFKKALIREMSNPHFYYFEFLNQQNNVLQTCRIRRKYGDLNNWYCEIWDGIGYRETPISDINNIESIYKKFQPVYGEQYLENGKLYKRRGYYGN